MDNRRLSNIAPKSAQYGGVSYRSGTERTWAVFLDVLGVAHRYEPETFDLPGWGRYTPDFHLPELNVWLEVKPADQEIRRLERCKADVFAQHCEGRVWLSRGYPIARSGYIEQIANGHGGSFEFCCIALDEHYPKEGVWLVGCDRRGHALPPRHIGNESSRNPRASRHIEPGIDCRIQIAFSNAANGGITDATHISVPIERARRNHRIRTGQHGGIAFDEDW